MVPWRFLKLQRYLGHLDFNVRINSDVAVAAWVFQIVIQIYSVNDSAGIVWENGDWILHWLGSPTFLSYKLEIF